MKFIHNEDETILRETAVGFFGDKAPVSEIRRLRDSSDANGYSKQLWQDMANMGFLGVLIPEKHGGNDMGYRAMGLIAEEIGKNLSAGPFLSTAVLAATAIRKGGTEEQQAAWLPAIANGSTIMALALDEGGKHNPLKTSTTAQQSGNGFSINGAKSMVVDGHMADQMIVVARTSGEPGDIDGLSLFLVESDKKGVETERTIMVDSRNAARVTFNNVDVDGDRLIGTLNRGGDILKKVLNAGRVALAAELLGAGSRAFGITLDYIKERKQFGRIIGEFQALQHRASHLFCEFEICRSAIIAALTALDTDDPNAGLCVSMAKAKLGDVARLASLEGIQMHGGVGMTDEYDIGLYAKRIRVAQELFGDTNYQLEQVARAKQF